MSDYHGHLQRSCTKLRLRQQYMSVHETAKAMGWSYRYDEWISAGGYQWKDPTGALRADPTVDDMLLWVSEQGWPLDTVVTLHILRNDDARYRVTCYNASNALEENGEIVKEGSTLWEAVAQVVKELGSS